MPTLFPWVCLICLTRLQLPWAVGSLHFILYPRWLGAWHVLNKCLFVGYGISVPSSYSLNTSGQPHCHSIRIQMVSICGGVFLHFVFGWSCTPLCLHHLVCFMRNVLLGLSSALLFPPRPPCGSFTEKPFVLSKQALICTSSSALHQGCQVSILTPA